MLTLNQQLELLIYRQERGENGGENGGKTNQVSLQKNEPPDTQSGGKRDAYLECACSKEHGRPVIEVAGGRPATSHGRPAKGQKGQ